LLLLALLAGSAPAAPALADPPASQGVSEPARRLADWAIASGDPAGRPFVIVDKREARVLAFDPQGVLIGSTPALLGLARGDDNVPGIGSMRLAQITPAQRITPAGRFEARLGTNVGGHRILWIDYAAALSLHPVVTTNAAERRLQRLASSSVLDNRISYGCINVPAAFYGRVIEPLFAPADGIVYILPETRDVAELLTPGPATPASR
jgi:hypothetical protein